MKVAVSGSSQVRESFLIPPVPRTEPNHLSKCTHCVDKWQAMIQRESGGFLPAAEVMAVRQVLMLDWFLLVALLSPSRVTPLVLCPNMG